MLDVSKLTEFQRGALEAALARIEQPPADVLPPSEQFWRGVTDGMRIAAAAEGLLPDAVEWIAREFHRRLAVLPYCPPQKVKRRDIETVITGLYHHIARVTYETLRDWYATTKGRQNG